MNLVINTDLIKQYLNNNEVDAIVYNGIELESLIINGEELWTSSLFKYARQRYCRGGRIFVDILLFEAF